MSTLDRFLTEVRTHPKFIAAANVDPGKLEALTDMANFFAQLEFYSHPRFIDLHDDVARIVGAGHRPIKERLNELHATMQAVLPWIKAMTEKMPAQRN